MKRPSVYNYKDAVCKLKDIFNHFTITYDIPHDSFLDLPELAEDLMSPYFYFEILKPQGCLSLKSP